MKRTSQTLTYSHTIYASYIGYISQAVVNNFVPLLFLTLMSDYSLTLDKVTLITTVNFAVQLAVDVFCAGAIDKIGYRISIVAAHILCAAGIAGLAALPAILPSVYAGIMMSVVMYAVGGGIIETLISPIVEACPTKEKETAMSMLHSFYCWGHMAVVIISTLFFKLFGTGNWRIMAFIWAALPLANAFYFSRVPIYPVTGGHEKLSLTKLFKQKIFWLLMVLMVCAGASEQAMSQWASAFAESGLRVSKTVGDLAGPCAFAMLMGTSRALYGKFGERIPLKKFMAASAALCVLCYITAVFAKNPLIALIGCAMCGFSVGIAWPGTFSISAKSLPGGGTAMYAILALAGDIGCTSGPTVVGFAANAAGGELKSGILAAIAFPIIMLLGVLTLKDNAKTEKAK